MSVADKLGFGPKREVHRTDDGGAVITVTPPTMFVPGAPSVTVRLTASQYDNYVLWQKGWMLVQEALPDLSAADREKLMTGLE